MRQRVGAGRFPVAFFRSSTVAAARNAGLTHPARFPPLEPFQESRSRGRAGFAQDRASLSGFDFRDAAVAVRTLSGAPRRMHRAGLAFFRIIVLICMLTSWISHLLGRPLRTDEEVMFFPTTARFASDDMVELGIEAWVYEKERRPGVTTVFRRYLRLDPTTLTADENAAFLQRVRLFLTDSEGGKLVPIAITTPLQDEPRSLGLPVTPPSGRTAARLLIPTPRHRDTSWINFEARGPAKTFRGRALLVPEHGLSVVSDIDDTIKHTHVLDRREMLLNTFTRPLAPVPGMAELYQRAHAAAGASTRFHYVSGGPHQLWPMIEGFLQGNAFPDGSVHMRSINWRVEVFGESPGTLGHKLTTIAGLIRDFPARRFVLVGDSGERDPEIYGQIARDFPAQVAAVFIRDITADARDGPRYAEAFRGVPAGVWSLFTDPATIDLTGAALGEVTSPPLTTTPVPGG